MLQFDDLQTTEFCPTDNLPWPPLSSVLGGIRFHHGLSINHRVAEPALVAINSAQITDIHPALRAIRSPVRISGSEPGTMIEESILQGLAPILERHGNNPGRCSVPQQ